MGDSAYKKQDSLFLPLPMVPSHLNPHNSPYTLEIEYEYEKSVNDFFWCFLFVVFLFLQHFNKVQNYLKCTKEEHASSKKMKQFSWEFGSKTQFFSESFTLTSAMLEQDSDLVSQRSENFIILSYQIKVAESGNALSIITSYSFAQTMLSLSLINKKTGNIVAIEKLASLEDIQPEV